MFFCYFCAQTQSNMKDKTVRIKDIALKANVSTGTVDRVLHKRGRVAKDVEERVLSIIKELNYEPNLMARALGSQKVYRFAALIPDAQFDVYWYGPKAGVEQAFKELKQFGVEVNFYFFNPYEVASFILAAQQLQKTELDGVLLSPIFYREALPFFEQWKAQNIPFVLFNTEITDYQPLSYIGQDSYLSGMLAAKMLHYGLPEPSSILIAHFDEDITNAAHLVKKESGFRNYFIQNQLNDTYQFIKEEFNSAQFSVFHQQLSDVIENNPDLKGIYVTTSKAFEIAAYLKERHINHIKIVGYDLLPKNVHFLNNGMISFLINQNPKGQGYWGIHQLANHLVFKKDVAVFKYLPLDIVTKENLNYFLDKPDY